MKSTIRTFNNSPIFSCQSLFSPLFKRLIGSLLSPYFVKDLIKLGLNAIHPRKKKRLGPNAKLMKSISKVHKSMDDRTYQLNIED